MQNHQTGWRTISFEPPLDNTPFQISASPPLAKQCFPIFLTLPVRSFVDWGMQLDSDCTDIRHARNCCSTLRARPNDFAENEETVFDWIRYRSVKQRYMWQCDINLTGHELPAPTVNINFGTERGTWGKNWLRDLASSGFAGGRMGTYLGCLVVLTRISTHLLPVLLSRNTSIYRTQLKDDSRLPTQIWRIYVIHFAEVLFEDDSRVARHVIYYYGSVGPLLEDENSKLIHSTRCENVGRQRSGVGHRHQVTHGL